MLGTKIVKNNFESDKLSLQIYLQQVDIGREHAVRLAQISVYFINRERSIVCRRLKASANTSFGNKSEAARSSKQDTLQSRIPFPSSFLRPQLFASNSNPIPTSRMGIKIRSSIHEEKNWIPFKRLKRKQKLKKRGFNKWILN